MLSPVGLGLREEELYLALLRSGGETRAELARVLPSWPAARLTRVLKALAAQGLVRTLAGRPPRYAAVAPDLAVETLARQSIDQVRQVQAAIPALMEVYWQAQCETPSFDFVEVITEDMRARVKRARQLMLSVSETVRAFECPPFPWQPKADSEDVGRQLADDMGIERKLMARGVKYRVIYDQDHVDTDRWSFDVTTMVREGEEGRVCGNLPIKLILYDDWAAAIPIPSTASGDTSIGSIIVHKSPLLDGLSALFEAYWANAVPLMPDGVPDGPGTFDQQLIALMAGGLTDDAAARALSVSRSTVQRRVNELMKANGVRTRFQLGLALAASARD